MKKRIVYVLLMLCAVVSGQIADATADSQAQLDVNALVEVPNSPEAEAFTRYGNVPVSYYTGKPNISVPVYTIQGREMSVPVSLTYDVSGIKVQSISTSAGAGWNLNAGGMVTRQVNDLPDDLNSSAPSINVKEALGFNTYLDSFRNPEKGYYYNFERYEHELQKIKDFIRIKNHHSLGQADLMPDVFNFHAPGLSGSMMINPATGKTICINNSDIKATYTAPSSGSITAWTITNTDGTKYYFNKSEETTTTFDSGGTEGTRRYHSGWYLTKIESANKKDIFDFSYSTGQYWDQPQIHYNRQVARNILSPCAYESDPNIVDNTVDPTIHEQITTSNLTDFRIKQSYLTGITHNGKSIIHFYHTDERLDLKGRKRLEHIDIKYDTKPLKRITLHHSYFKAIDNPTKEEEYRLKLDYVTITGYYDNTVTTPLLQQTTSPQQYAFTYYGDNFLPSRTSLAIDLLGYYNGSNGKNNTSLIPKYIDAYGHIFPGANRDPDFNSRIKGMLKEIQYPTGGSTEFEFDQILLSTTNDPQRGGQGLVSIGSGADPRAEESDYRCDDGFWHFPQTATNTFTVQYSESKYEKAAEYRFDVKTEGSYNQTGRVFFMAIYKSTPTSSVPRNYTTLPNGCIEVPGFTDPIVLCPGECKEVAVGISADPTPFTICYDTYVNPPVEDNAKSFCEIQQMITDGDPDLVYHSYAVPNDGGQLKFSVGTQQLNYLDPGTYKVFMANSLLGVHVSLTRSFMKDAIKNQWSNPIISKITDKTNQGETYLKTLEYLDHSIKQYAQLHNVTVTGNASVECYKLGREGIYETLERHSSNLYPAVPNEITYPQVRETIEDVDGNTLGSTVYEFYDQPYYPITDQPYGLEGSYHPAIGKPYIQTDPLDGQLKETSQYDQAGRMLQVSTSAFGFEKSLVAIGTHLYGGTTMLDVCTVVVDGDMDPNLKKILYVDTTAKSEYVGDIPSKACRNQNGMTVINNWRNVTKESDTPLRFFSFSTKLQQTVSKQFFYQNNTVDSIVQKTAYEYGTHHNMPLMVTTSLSEGEKTITETKYPQDLAAPNAAEQALIAQNRIATPIAVTNTILEGDNEYVAQKKNVFTDTKWPGYVFPEKIQTAKGKEATLLEDRIYYNQYENGNPVAVSRKDGIPISYIWGYNEQYPIAKIENLSYAMIPAETITNLKNLSNADTSKESEDTLRTALQELQVSFPEAMITTYTYDPLVGITSMTDPKGYTLFYEYDEYSRLMHTRDADTNITNKYYYNYKGVLFSPLQVSITSAKNWILTNTSLGIQSSVTGGSGRFAYHWKITKPNNIIAEYTSRDITLQAGTIKGMATLELTIQDIVTGKKETTTKSISIYPPLAVSNSNISRPANVSVRSTASFNISPSAGSGSYTYAWRIYNSRKTYRSTSKSFSMTMGCEYFGQVRVECIVTDAITGDTKMVNTTMQVDDAFWGITSFSTRRHSTSSRTKRLDVIANISGGSGSYTYKWYVDGVYKTSSSTGLVTLKCSGKRSAVVKCIVTDGCTGSSASRSQSYNMTTSECSSGGGIGGGGGLIDTNQ